MAFTTLVQGFHKTCFAHAEEQITCGQLRSVFRALGSFWKRNELEKGVLTLAQCVAQCVKSALCPMSEPAEKTRLKEFVA